MLRESGLMSGVLAFISFELRIKKARANYAVYKARISHTQPHRIQFNCPHAIEEKDGHSCLVVKRSNSIASVVCLLAFLVGALVAGFWLFRLFLKPFAFAAVIGIGFYPFYLRISRFMRGPNKSALLATLAVLLIFVLPTLLIASAAGVELIKVARYLGDRSTQEGGAVAYLIHRQQSALQWLGKYVDVEVLHLENAMATLPGKISGFLLKAGSGLVGALAGFAGNSILTFLILFFVFRDGHSAIEKVTSALPLSRDQAVRLFTGIRDSIVANLYGILAVGLAQGLLTGAALAILRVPSALLLGLTAAVCSLIPIAGTTVVWVPAAIYLMVTGHLLKAIILILWGALVVGTVDNIIRPLVIGSRVELHPLLLLFALLGGLQAFGFIGLFIGPLVISLIAALTIMVKEELNAQSNDAPANTGCIL
jgi:predicted PurR-regulated permease PerM